MSFKRLLAVGLMALLCAGTATAASQLNAVQLTPAPNAATVNLRTTGSYAHKEYRPDEHLMLVDLTGVAADPAIDRAATVNSAALTGYKLSTYTSASGSQVTRVELTLGNGVTANVTDESYGLKIQLNSGAPFVAVTSSGSSSPSPVAVTPARKRRSRQSSQLGGQPIRKSICNSGRCLQASFGIASHSHQSASCSCHADGPQCPGAPDEYAPD